MEGPFGWSEFFRRCVPARRSASRHLLFVLEEGPGSRAGVMAVKPYVPPHQIACIQDLHQLRIIRRYSDYSTGEA